MDYDPAPPTGSDPVPRTQLGSPRHARRKAPFERRVRILCLFIAAPAFVLAAVLLWQAKFSSAMAEVLLGGVACLSLIAAGMLLEQIVRPLQTLANVVSALRESDYSFRARGGRRSDALGELALEINEFADLLQSQRLGEMEATALLRCVISSMDAPVLAFDPAHRLRLINPAAERIFRLNAQRALGRSADSLQLSVLLDQPDQGILVLAGKGNPVHWMVRRSGFRQRGIPHTLLVLSDVSIALREQERDAWQRLIRVIGHEINNSLTPIKSIAGSLRSWIHTRPLNVQTMEAPGVDDVVHLERGLKIIESRAESLNRFIQAYRQLAQLPPPALKAVALRSLLERAVALENRVVVDLQPGPDIVLQLDPDQVEQLVINLLRNASEAALARFPDGSSKENDKSEVPLVTITWQTSAQAVAILIQDNGIGLINPSNLFVPFYTTKPGGSGIGLALARQICEAHGGVLQVANRLDGQGCRAEVRLPFSPSQGILHPDLDPKMAGNRVSG
jgi:two-component system, NtrC family, nitrogen regulation sensor histidine kinase NtrY